MLALCRNPLRVRKFSDAAVRFANKNGPVHIYFGYRIVQAESSFAAPIGWAWLQGNSRARRLHSAVPTLAGFGFHPRLPASPFSKAQNNLFRTLRKTGFAWLESGPLRSGSPQPIGAGKEGNMLCKNRITLIGFIGQDAETRSTPNGNHYTRLSLATSISWKDSSNTEYKTRTEWHRVICWNKLADWASNLQKGAYVEVEGELRYREYTPNDSDRSVRLAEIYATSVLALDRSVAQNGSTSADPESDEPAD